jgi:inositol phosphorylceramide mannosyltransferase catalytic subunit
MSERIPRRIIQMDSRKELPLLTKAVVQNLRLLNPDFEYLFFDGAGIESFVDSEFPQYRSLFESFPAPIQRYDFFRYLAVYRLGGFYFDTDVLLASGLDSLLDFSCVFPFEHLGLYDFLNEEYGMDWEIGNYAFGAAAGHPFLDAIIKNCIRAREHPQWAEPMIKSIPKIFRAEYRVLTTTGPGLVSRTLAEYPGACQQVNVLFPDDICDPKSWYCFGDYGVHLQVGGWRKRMSLVPRVLHRYWERSKREALLKESMKRGRKREMVFVNSS